jgi:hypothetical protein
MSQIQTEIHDLLHRQAKLSFMQAQAPADEIGWIMEALKYLLFLELVKREPSPNATRAATMRNTPDTIERLSSLHEPL